MDTLTYMMTGFAWAIAVASALFAASSWWTNREKLRLVLYHRRFEIYSRTLDLYHALVEWTPTDQEKSASTLENSPDLKKAQHDFLHASREAQFLFDKDSGIHPLLEQMHQDMLHVIAYKRDVAPALSHQPLTGKEDFAARKAAYDKFEQSLQRIHAAIPTLEEKISGDLDFHRLSAWGGLLAR